VCNVFFIVCVALCVVFCLSLACYFVICDFWIVPPGDPFAVKLNNNNDNTNKWWVLTEPPRISGCSCRCVGVPYETLPHSGGW
jgi:hypothetical protein